MMKNEDPANTEKQIKGIIDRFEGELAVIEIEGKSTNVPKSLLEPGCREGDVVIWNGEAWRRDESETMARRREVQKLMKDVWID